MPENQNKVNPLAWPEPLSLLPFSRVGRWWNGIHSTLKMSSGKLDEGSTPSRPTNKNALGIKSVFICS